MAINTLDQRRHQRIRFEKSPSIRLGYGGVIDEGVIVNLSLTGLMFRTAMELDIGHIAGCEFSLFGSPLVDVPVTIVSRVGDLFGARFQSGPINQVIIDDAISRALASGEASILSVHEIAGRKVLRIVGGLNVSLQGDFMHALTRVGIDELDLGGVSKVDQAGLAMCLVAQKRYAVLLGAQSEYFAAAWTQAWASPRSLEKS